MFKSVFIFGIVLIVNCLGELSPLSPQQEQDIINHIKKEISSTEVHDVETLDACLVKIANLVKPYMKYGIKTWDVPVLDPFYLKIVKVDQNDGSTTLRAHFKDVYVHGLSGFTVNYIKSKPEDYSFEFSLNIPHLRMSGHYDIDGKLLIMTLKDHGPFTANLTRVEAIGHAKFQILDGLLHLHEVHSDFKFKTFRFHLDNLFRGNPIGESVNESLNADVDSLLHDLKPAFIKEINKIIIKTLTKGLENLPLEKWQAAIH